MFFIWKKVGEDLKVFMDLNFVTWDGSLDAIILICSNL